MIAEPCERRSAADLLASLGSSDAGLSDAEARRRLTIYGPNEIAGEGRRPLLLDIVRRLANPLVAMLIVASIIAGTTGDLASFVIITAIVAVSTALELLQERHAQASVAALRRSIALTACAWRGKQTKIAVRDLVPGDVVSLQAGDLVPADGIVLAANAAQVNQAVLTGEPYPAAKCAPARLEDLLDDDSNRLLHGSSMIGGTATMLVVTTGRHTQLGKIAGSLADRQPPSAFERGIHRLGILIVRLTLFLTLFVLVTHLALGRPPLQSFLFAMALAVGLTPELLPMIVTIALARGAQRMAADRVIVKRLAAIHDLGEMDILCTDKTGTLTEARIELVAHPDLGGSDNQRVVELAAINATFETGLKSPLDVALIDHGAELTIERWSKLDERPFDFERRRVSVLAEHDGHRMEIVKGAPETIWSLCDRAEMPDGSLAPFNDDLRKRARALHEERSAAGYRLLAVAWKEAEGRQRIDTDDDAGLVFAGYCIFADPPKASAAGAIARLEALGVGIKVLSGDTANVVAHVVHALGVPSDKILTGDEVAALDDGALAARVEQVDLFARLTPDQKLRVVRALQARGHTVGFLGDGINDAPAIRAADVGLSVDGATDVAREAADMILLAADLNAVADGVEEGRRTYANIMNYIRMGTSSNFGNMLTMALASLALPFLPLTAVQLLLNNLIYDLSQIGIPFDRSSAVDLKKPHGWNMRRLVRFSLIMGPLSSVFDIATFGLLLGWQGLDVASFRAAWFIESIATQILVVFIIRTPLPVWRSAPHRALLASAFGGLLLAVSLPFSPLADLLGFGRLAATSLATIAALVVAYLLAAEALKRFALAAPKENAPARLPVWKGRF